MVLSGIQTIREEKTPPYKPPKKVKIENIRTQIKHKILLVGKSSTSGFPAKFRE